MALTISPLPPFAGLPLAIGKLQPRTTPVSYVPCNYDENGDCACPSGYYDGGDGYCYEITSGIPVVCPIGYYDNGQGVCIPISIGGIPPIDVGSGTTTSTGGGDQDNITVNVKVDNAETIAADTLKQVTDAINTGINDAVAPVIKVVDTAVTEIDDVVRGTLGTIWNAIQSALSAIAGAIGNIVSTVLSSVKDAFGTIVNTIGDAISSLKDVVVTIVNKIAPILSSITDEVKTINDTLIQPISTFITTTVKTIADLTVAIQKDLHDGLSGLVNIPGQISGALTGLDASLNRTIQQLGIQNAEQSQSNINFEAKTLPGPYSVAYKTAFGGVTDPASIKTTFGASVTLSGESLQQVSSEAISALGALTKELLHLIWSTGKDSFDQIHADWSSAESVFVSLLDGILGVVTTLTAVGSLVEPLIEAAAEEARTRIPVTKLGVGETIAAMRRGFLSDKDGATELSKLGYDSTRIQVMKDLDVFLADVNTALEWRARGIISDDDLTANLKDHGITADDIAALKEANVHIPDTGEITRWLDFDAVTTDDVAAVLRKLHYDEPSIKAYLDTYQTRESAQARAALDGRLTASGRGWLNNTMLTDTPENVILAGKRQGLHPDATRLLWQAHWNVPSYLTILQSFYRGLRTRTEVENAMLSENIPQELWDDLIEVNRPLIQFRSLASYIKAGVMTMAQAQNILAAHGFSLENQNILLGYFEKVIGATKATAATAVHTLSIANARTLFLDGALTDKQYIALLEEHGYSADLAAAQAQVDALNAHAKQRKQELADMAAQVEAGVLSGDDAIAQLTKDGFTDAEINTWQAKVSKALKIGARHPSLSELDKFLKAQLITLDQYQTELQAQGWQEPWLSAFLGLVSAGGVPAVP
jgi:hypothetical protein